jgi:c-di-GMP-binding flagellar brake protein YcgR
VFLIIGLCFLALLSITLLMLWAHEKITNKKIVPHAVIKELWAGEERREHSRFDKNLEVEYCDEKKPHLKNGKTLNISKGGMKLLIDDKLPVGAVIDMKIYIPEKKRTIEIESEIAWTKDVEGFDASGKRLFQCGVKFIAIKEPSGAHFIEYINSLGENG